MNDSSMDVIKEEESADTVLENKRADSFEKKDIDSCEIDLEKIKKKSEFSFSNPAFKTVDEPTMDGREAVVTLNEASGTESTEIPTEQPKKEYEFSFSNPGFINEDKQNMAGEISQGMNQIDSQPTITDGNATVALDEDSSAQASKTPMEQPIKETEIGLLNPLLISEDKQNAGEILQETKRRDGDRQLENLVEERLSNRSDSSGFSEGYASSPETASVDSAEASFAERKSRIGQKDYTKEEISSQTRPRSLSTGRSRGNSFTKGTDTSYSGVSVIIEEVNEPEIKRSKRRKTWTDWFKTPMFYKVFNVHIV